MKYKNIFLLTITITSSCLLGMFSVPNVTQWQKICKDPEDKKKLTQVYTNFCRDRLHKNLMIFGSFGTGSAIADTIAVKCFKKPIHWNQFAIPMLCCSVIARNYYQYQLAQKENFSHLNRDVLHQLGRPSKIKNSEVDCLYHYNNPNDYQRWMWIFYVPKSKSTYIPLKVNTVQGIEGALSGNYRAM